MKIKANAILDAKGLACPMPIVKTKKEMKSLTPGDVLEVQATDQGSTADLKSWARSVGHQYLGTIEDSNVLKHYVRKTSGADEMEKKHPHIATNDDIVEKLTVKEDIVILDVREAAEFAFSHISEAQNIPLGDLEVRAGELPNEKEIYVICRTGNRSDIAARQLTDLGFTKVFNVIPGMSQWTGDTAKRV